MKGQRLSFVYAMLAETSVINKKRNNEMVDLRNIWLSKVIYSKLQNQDEKVMLEGLSKLLARRHVI